MPSTRQYDRSTSRSKKRPVRGGLNRLLEVEEPTKDEIIALASTVFGNPDKAAREMDRGKHPFDERSPMEMLDSADGRRRMREMLAQIDEDLFA
jgi:hypothetical protein